MLWDGWQTSWICSQRHGVSATVSKQCEVWNSSPCSHFVYKTHSRTYPCRMQPLHGVTSTFSPHSVRRLSSTHCLPTMFLKKKNHPPHLPFYSFVRSWARCFCTWFISQNILDKVFYHMHTKLTIVNYTRKDSKMFTFKWHIHPKWKILCIHQEDTVPTTAALNAYDVW